MQDIYQQLQDLCNRQIAKGREPRGSKFDRLNITEGGIVAHWGDGEYLPMEMWMHDLFSVDSGFMESVNWKHTYFPAWSFSCAHHKYHMQYMGNMTAEQKIQYVLDNVVTSEE